MYILVLRVYEIYVNDMERLELQEACDDMIWYDYDMIWYYEWFGLENCQFNLARKLKELTVLNGTEI